MQIRKPGTAGTLESGDIYIEIEPADGAVEIALESTVKSLYGRQIEAVIRETLAEAGVVAARVAANDKGALDCTVQARTLTALQRAAGEAESAWSAEGRRTHA
jgi:citrate lyase subunit gamma (acyl carrier protein)